MEVVEAQEARAFLGRRDWLALEGLRLDASAYASGGLQVRDHITSGPWEVRRLEHVSRCFVESRFVRRYVTDPDRGLPYLTASDMLLTDLTGLLRLSIRGTPQLSKLLIRHGWTLMSCSGTIGRSAFVRSEMEGMAASHDVIRILPDDTILSGGYLFAFLSTGHAQAMIRQRTYGSVVQHIEPHHIADLPVPLPDESFQQHIHHLVVGAAEARTEASRLLDQAASHFDRLAGPMPSLHEHSLAVGTVMRSKLGLRLDAFHSVGWAAEGQVREGDVVSDLGEVISTSRVPRVYVRRGVPFLSGIDVFRIRPTVRVQLAAHIAHAFQARVKAGDLAIQGSGQRYGLLGRVAYIGSRLDGWAASHDLFRVRTGSLAHAARMVAFFRSASGRRAMLRHSYGTSIPHVNPQGIAAIRVPRLPEALEVNSVRALQLREQADASEDRAIREVEAWVG